jgi:putative aminopeptidase FrvX
MEFLTEQMRDLGEIPSVTGREDEMAEFLTVRMSPLVDEVSRDVLGNVVAVKRGKGRDRLRILLDAHMDQIGLMITHIEENGILRFTGVGGVNPQTLYGKRVTLFGRKNLLGIVGMKPPHLLGPEEKGKAHGFEDLFIDTGLGSRREVGRTIQVGDTAAVDGATLALTNDHMAGSGLDNKAGVLTLLSAAVLMEPLRQEHDVIFLFAVQEEVGLRGAGVAGYTIDPDIAVVCDVDFGDPGGERPGGGKSEIRTGKGPVVSIGPNFSPALVRRIREIAKREDIPIQESVEPHPGGTDAYPLQVARRGVYTAGVSIPLRYMHSQTEVISLMDVYRASKLMAHLARDPEPLGGERI